MTGRRAPWARHGHAILVLVAATAPAQERAALPGGEPRTAAAAALRFVFAQQRDDGSIRSDVHGVLRPGCSTTATALLAAALLPERLRAPHAAAIARAFAFLRGRTAADGAIGLGGDEGVDYPTYSSAHLLHALAVLRPPGSEAAIAQQIARLSRVQLDPGEGWEEGDAAFGAFGFGTTPVPKPLGAGLADIALQTTVLEALRAAGMAADDPVVRRAMRFVARCQRRCNAGGDGGFVFAQEPPWRVSKAGTDEAGAGRSYGTTTADGIRALLAAGTAADDPALREAIAWLDAHLDFARVPGLPRDAEPPIEPALRLYWSASLARTLRALERTDPLRKRAGDWRERLCAELLPRQRADGSFVGHSDLMKEDDPLVASLLALFALGAVLSAP